MTTHDTGSYRTLAAASPLNGCTSDLIHAVNSGPDGVAQNMSIGFPIVTHAGAFGYQFMDTNYSSSVFAVRLTFASNGSYSNVSITQLAVSFGLTDTCGASFPIRGTCVYDNQTQTLSQIACSACASGTGCFLASYVCSYAPGIGAPSLFAAVGALNLMVVQALSRAPFYLTKVQLVTVNATGPLVAASLFTGTCNATAIPLAAGCGWPLDILAQPGSASQSESRSPAPTQSQTKTRSESHSASASASQTPSTVDELPPNRRCPIELFDADILHFDSPVLGMAYNHPASPNNYADILGNSTLAANLTAAIARHLANLSAATAVPVFDYDYEERNITGETPFQIVNTPARPRGAENIYEQILKFGTGFFARIRDAQGNRTKGYLLVDFDPDYLSDMLRQLEMTLAPPFVPGIYVDYDADEHETHIFGCGYGVYLQQFENVLDADYAPQDYDQYIPVLFDDSTPILTCIDTVMRRNQRDIVNDDGDIVSYPVDAGYGDYEGMPPAQRTMAPGPLFREGFFPTNEFGVSILVLDMAEVAFEGPLIDPFDSGTLFRLVPLEFMQTADTEGAWFRMGDGVDDKGMLGALPVVDSGYARMLMVSQPGNYPYGEEDTFGDFYFDARFMFAVSPCRTTCLAQATHAVTNSPLSTLSDVVPNRINPATSDLGVLIDMEHGSQNFGYDYEPSLFPNADLTAQMFNSYTGNVNSGFNTYRVTTPAPLDYAHPLHIVETLSMNIDGHQCVQILETMGADLTLLRNMTNIPFTAPTTGLFLDMSRMNRRLDIFGPLCVLRATGDFPLPNAVGPIVLLPNNIELYTLGFFTPEDRFGTERTQHVHLPQTVYSFATNATATARVLFGDHEYARDAQGSIDIMSTIPLLHVDYTENTMTQDSEAGDTDPGFMGFTAFQFRPLAGTDGRTIEVFATGFLAKQPIQLRGVVSKCSDMFADRFALTPSESTSPVPTQLPTRHSPVPSPQPCCERTDPAPNAGQPLCNGHTAGRGPVCSLYDAPAQLAFATKEDYFMYLGQGDGRVPTYQMRDEFLDASDPTDTIGWLREMKQVGLRIGMLEFSFTDGGNTFLESYFVARHDGSVDIELFGFVRGSVINGSCELSPRDPLMRPPHTDFLFNHQYVFNGVITVGGTGTTDVTSALYGASGGVSYMVRQTNRDLTGNASSVRRDMIRDRMRGARGDSERRRSARGRDGMGRNREVGNIQDWTCLTDFGGECFYPPTNASTRNYLALFPVDGNLDEGSLIMGLKDINSAYFPGSWLAISKKNAPLQMMVVSGAGTTLGSYGWTGVASGELLVLSQPPMALRDIDGATPRQAIMEAYATATTPINPASRYEALLMFGIEQECPFFDLIHDGEGSEASEVPVPPSASRTPDVSLPPRTSPDDFALAQYAASQVAAALPLCLPVSNIDLPFGARHVCGMITPMTFPKYEDSDAAITYVTRAVSRPIPGGGGEYDYDYGDGGPYEDIPMTAVCFNATLIGRGTSAVYTNLPALAGRAYVDVLLEFAWTEGTRLVANVKAFVWLYDSRWRPIGSVALCEIAHVSRTAYCGHIAVQEAAAYLQVGVMTAPPYKMREDLFLTGVRLLSVHAAPTPVCNLLSIVYGTLEPEAACVLNGNGNIPSLGSEQSTSDAINAGSYFLLILGN